jgi:hypothetical protein
VDLPSCLEIKAAGIAIIQINNSRKWAGDVVGWRWLDEGEESRLATGDMTQTRCISTWEKSVFEE